MDQIAVIGAGTMGSGIAQLAAASGCRVQLLDTSEAILSEALREISSRYDREVHKHRMTAEEADAARGRLLPAVEPRDLHDCDAIIEAVVEDMDAKIAALSAILESTGPHTIFASNTSSLSITALGDGLGIPERVCGMHFFNPAPIMPLVEIIAGNRSAPQTIERAAELATDWGKAVVQANDTPGFIVNRVARPFYLESLRIIDERLASCEAVDLIMKEVGGFKMGPFELMDLVGIDVNYAVTCSIYEQMDRPPRFRPSETQERLVELGRLGRKSEVGFYSYGGDRPEISYRLDTETIEMPAAVRQAYEQLDASAGWDIQPESGYVFGRILAALMNEAALAEQEGVASATDIDVAMKLGTNYPKGLLKWANEIGHRPLGAFLQALNAQVDDNRFAPARRFIEAV